MPYRGFLSQDGALVGHVLLPEWDVDFVVGHLCGGFSLVRILVVLFVGRRDYLKAVVRDDEDFLSLRFVPGGGQSGECLGALIILIILNRRFILISLLILRLLTLILVHRLAMHGLLFLFSSHGGIIKRNLWRPLMILIEIFSLFQEVLFDVFLCFLEIKTH